MEMHAITGTVFWLAVLFFFSLNKHLTDHPSHFRSFTAHELCALIFTGQGSPGITIGQNRTLGRCLQYFNKCNNLRKHYWLGLASLGSQEKS